MSSGNMELLAEKSKRTFSRKSNQTIDYENDAKYKLSFAFQNLNEINQNQLPENREKIFEINLTENNLNGSNDLRFLFEFSNLKTLILDKNQIQSNIRLPLMEKLTTLWVNHNKIDNLAIFVQNIAEACPNLKYLSMINNKAAPSYFNGGSLNEYNDYRLFVISKLKHLTLLDDKEVTLEERTQSFSIYGKTRPTTIRKNFSIYENKKNVSKSEANSNKKKTTKIITENDQNKILTHEQECFKILPEILNLTNEEKIEPKKLLKRETEQSAFMPSLQDLESLPEMPHLNNSIENLEIPDLPQLP